jgi:peroxin-7
MNMLPPPATLHTPGFAHYALAWSPFHDGRLAIASAANFGLVGNGRLHLASVPPGQPNLNVDKLYVQVAWEHIRTQYFEPE